MPEQSFSEHHIGKAWAGPLANLLGEANFGTSYDRNITFPAQGPAPADLVDVSIIRADGSEEPVYRAGTGINVSPGDSIRIRGNILRLIK